MKNITIDSSTIGVNFKLSLLLVIDITIGDTHIQMYTYMHTTIINSPREQNNCVPDADFFDMVCIKGKPDGEFRT